MKIYWKILIWNFTVLPWLKLIHYRKSDYWKVNHSIYWNWMWTPKRKADCAKAMASLLPKLDDVIRRVTAKDNAITTIVSTSIDQKVYKSGKVIAVKKIT